MEFEERLSLAISDIDVAVDLEGMLPFEALS